MGKPHNELLKAAMEYLELRGVFAWPNNTGGAMVKGGHFMRFGTRGSPDIIGILPGGRFLGVEIKVGRDRLSKAQHVFATHIRGAGGRFIECRQLEDIEEALNRDD